MMNLKPVIAVLSLVFASNAAQYKGTVIDEDGSKPVKGVVVSVGYSQFRTVTDGDGNFYLDTDASQVFKRVSKPNPVRIFWDSHTGLIKLVNSSVLKNISIFNLNGRVVFKNDLTADIKQIKVPLLSKGVYLLQLASKTGGLYNFKINTAGVSALLRFNADISFKENAELSKSAELLFRHDDYYPLDMNVDSNGDLLVKMKNDPRSALFNKNKVYTFHFRISSEDSIKMEMEALKEKYVAAQLNLDGETFGTVGVRYKGSSYSLGNCFDTLGNHFQKKECGKVSLKVKFNKFTDSLRLYSMKELNLHSMFSDGSKMRDMISYQMFRDMGIYSPRTSYVKVYVNDVLWGIFVAVEAIDGRFTKARWPESGDGNLYKEAWPITNDTSYYSDMLETNNDPEDSADVSAMVDLYNAINSSTVETFTNNVSSFIDFDYLTRYMAVDRAIKNWDGITGWYYSAHWLGNHNYFFYQEEDPDGKIWLIPWDLDNTLQRSDPLIDDAQVANWNENPTSCDPVDVFTDSSRVIPSGCDKFISLFAANYWNNFVKVGDELLKWVYKPESIIKRIDSYCLLLDTVIKQDPHIEYPVWQNEVSNLKKNINSLHSRFYDYIHQVPDTVDTSDYSKPFDGVGYLVIDRTNNFEFTPADQFTYKIVLVSEGTEAKLVHSTENPLWGSADLLFSFVLNPLEDDKSYSEWTTLKLKTEKKSNILQCKEIRMNISADRQRYLWVSLNNNNGHQYGWAVYVSKNPKVYSFKINEISYPLWDDAGDPDQLEYALKYCTGICFGPSGVFDSMGELANPPDSGFIRIDNIKFVF